MRRTGTLIRIRATASAGVRRTSRSASAGIGAAIGSSTSVSAGLASSASRSSSTTSRLLRVNEGPASATGLQQLRPLALGEVLDVGIKIVARNAGTLFRVVVFVVLPVQLLSTLVQLSAAPSGWRPQGFPPHFQPPGDQFYVSRSDVLAEVGSVLVTSLLSFLAGIVAAGACYRAITSAYLGEPTGWRESLGFALRRLHSILWVTVIGGIFVVLGLIACIVPGVYLWGAFAVAVPVLLTEDVRGTKALGRSRTLVQGFWWRSFGVVVLGAILAGFISGALEGLVLALTSVGSGSATAVWVIANTAAGTVGKMISTPFTAAFVTVLYFDLRVRKEAFDLQLLARRIGVDPGPRRLALRAGSAAARPAAVLAAAAGMAAGARCSLHRRRCRRFPGAQPEQPPFWPPPPGWKPGGEG